jgi:predicted nucleic acid-binding protein
MRTAVDTNVISALWSGEPLAQSVAGVLSDAKMEGGLVIAAPVYAELLAYPNATESFLNSFLQETSVSVDFEFNQSIWLEAGRRFARYAKRRRKSRAGGPRRLLVDFVIGAHALAQADRLMTLDPNQYKRDFPELRII